MAVYIKTHCRCRKCGTRKALPRQPEQYTRPPPCPSCGERSWRRDKWMHTRYLASCLCDGYWFKHRRGSLYCHHRADGTARQFGDPDFADRHLIAA